MVNLHNEQPGLVNEIANEIISELEFAYGGESYELLVAALAQAIVNLCRASNDDAELAEAAGDFIADGGLTADAFL
jgi:hypothetical protein